MTPDRLGWLAGLSQWERYTWLLGASLSGTVLSVPTPEQAGTLERCYLSALQAVLPGLTVRCEPRKPVSCLKPQPVVRKPYMGQPAALQPVRDLLDADEDGA